MKTLATGVNRKTILTSLLFALLSCPLATQHLQAQILAIPRNSTSANIITGLQVVAHPIENTFRIKVMFFNSTGRELLLSIQNKSGKILYSKLYKHTDAFKGIFDLSLLEDGKYTLQVSTLMKSGFIKQSYKQSFQIQSEIKRRIAPFGPILQKEVITLQAN
jgi:hypothetical protein